MEVYIPKSFDQSPITPGVYKATITKSDLKRTKDNTKDMISLQFTISSNGPDPNEKTMGRKLFENLLLTEDSLWRADLVFKAATGKKIPEVLEPEKSYSTDEFYGFFSNLVINKEVILVVGVEVYEGKTQNKVSEVRSAS